MKPKFRTYTNESVSDIDFFHAEVKEKSQWPTELIDAIHKFANKTRLETRRELIDLL